MFRTTRDRSFLHYHGQPDAQLAKVAKTQNMQSDTKQLTLASKLIPFKKRTQKPK